MLSERPRSDIAKVKQAWSWPRPIQVKSLRPLQELHSASRGGTDLSQARSAKISLMHVGEPMSLAAKQMNALQTHFRLLQPRMSCPESREPVFLKTKQTTFLENWVLSTFSAITGNFVQLPFQSIPIASFAWLVKERHAPTQCVIKL